MRCGRKTSIVVLALLPVALAVAGVPEGLDALKRGDYATAVRELSGPAERGVAEAQYRVGLMYEFGKGYPKDMTQALAWVCKAAAQGHMGAQVEMGVLYTQADGVQPDPASALDWFRKAAAQGSAPAQYNIGLLYAKGSGVARDDAQAVAWFRKAADQGLASAQMTLGVAHENGQGVAEDPALAYADYAIAARNGSYEAEGHRNRLAKELTPAQLREGQAIAAAWEPGKPMPERAAAATARASTPARGPDRCTASGSMEGGAFTATHCAAAVLADQHSVAIWFNQDDIAPAEREAFAQSAHADESRGGRPRTMITVMFCPGGGAAQASPAAVRSVDVSTSHARSPLAGIQWVLEAPRELKVERMTGTIEPGGSVAGRMIGTRGKTTFTLDFDLALPAKGALAGMSCSK